jgi:glycosyltransferase involved in cell wall biosynthesis
MLGSFIPQTAKGLHDSEGFEGRQPMDVVHIINNLPVGGAEQFLVQLVRAQQSQGMRPRVLSLCEPNPLAHELAVPFECMGRRRLNDPRVIGDLVRALRRHPVDVVHTHLFYADTFGRIAARWNGNPVLSTVHSTEAGDLSRRRRLGMKLTVPLAKRVVAVSSAVQVAVCQTFRLPKSVVPIIPNGLDLSEYEQVVGLQRSELAVPPEALLVGCVGRIVASKGYDSLLQSVAQLPDIHLLMVGEGPEQQELRRLAQELGISDRTTWLGLRRDVPAILAALDVFAMPSHWEGHSIALLEAMAAGCALLVSDVPELTETTQDAGVRIVPGNVGSIVAGLQELHQADRRRQSAARAREQVQRFSIERSAQAYGTLYNEVLGVVSGRSEDA